MSGGNKIRDDAVRLIGEAVELDKQSKFGEALAKYTQAIEYFLHLIKFEKVPSLRAVLEERVRPYMERAEALHKMLTAPVAAAGAGGAATATADGKTEDDTEKNKMRGALAGAIVTEKPNVRWDDVAGLEGAKSLLREAVILPYKFPQLFQGKRKPWKGILLYGPPGTGKSYLAKAVATEADSTFFSVSSSDLVSKWQGESERLVRSLFEMAREAKKAIIFIDEIDSLCSSRSEGENDSTRRIKTEFLVQMQGVGKDSDGILVLGATNIPWDIDSAMRRRFEKRIYISLPDMDARQEMFKIHIGDTGGIHLEDSDLKELARLTEGFSGSDISVCVRDCLMEPIRRCQDARFFRRMPNGKYQPVELDEFHAAPCELCPKDLSFSPRPLKVDCPHCGCRACRLMDLTQDQLEVPNLVVADFMKVVAKSKPSVSPDDLGKYEKWTSEFGEEGV